MRTNTVSIDMDFRVIPSTIPLHSPSPDKKSLTILTPTISPNTSEIRKTTQTPIKTLRMDRLDRQADRQADRNQSQKQNQKFLQDLETQLKYQTQNTHTPTNNNGNQGASQAYASVLQEKDQVIRNLRNVIDMVTQNPHHPHKQNPSLPTNKDQENELRNEVKILTIENQKLVNIIDKMSKTRAVGTVGAVGGGTTAIGTVGGGTTVGAGTGDGDGDLDRKREREEYQVRIGELMAELREKEGFHQEETKQLKRFNKSLNSQLRNLQSQKCQLESENKKLLKLLRQRSQSQKLYSPLQLPQEQKTMPHIRSQQRITLQKIRQQHSQNLRMLKQTLMKQIEESFDTMRIALEGIGSRVGSVAKRLESIQKLFWDKLRKMQVHKESIVISIREGDQDRPDTDRSFKFQRKNKSEIYIEEGPSSSHERASQDQFTRLEEIPSPTPTPQISLLLSELTAVKAQLSLLRLKYDKLYLEGLEKEEKEKEEKEEKEEVKEDKKEDPKNMDEEEEKVEEEEQKQKEEQNIPKEMETKKQKGEKQQKTHEIKRNIDNDDKNIEKEEKQEVSKDQNVEQDGQERETIEFSQIIQVKKVVDIRESEKDQKHAKDIEEKNQQILSLLQHQKREVRRLYERIKAIDEEWKQKLRIKDKEIQSKNHELASLSGEFENRLKIHMQQTQSKVTMLIQTYEKEIQILKSAATPATIQQASQYRPNQPSQSQPTQSLPSKPNPPSPTKYHPLSTQPLSFQSPSTLPTLPFHPSSTLPTLATQPFPLPSSPTSSHHHPAPTVPAPGGQYPQSLSLSPSSIRSLQQELALQQEKHQYQYRILAEALEEAEGALRHERYQREGFEVEVMRLRAEVGQMRVDLERAKGQSVIRRDQSKRVLGEKEEVQTNYQKAIDELKQAQTKLQQQSYQLSSLSRSMTHIQQHPILPELSQLQSQLQHLPLTQPTITTISSSSSSSSSSSTLHHQLSQQIQLLRQQLFQAQTQNIEKQSRIYELEGLCQLARRKLQEQELCNQELVVKIGDLDQLRDHWTQYLGVLQGVKEGAVGKVRAIKRIELERIRNIEHLGITMDDHKANPSTTP